ncbi:uncharacterized protein MONOS_15220 [Monocercomonoides exilis]|uniref:uncharacterized protein n=1 Tax=Monocercomonoides exilis TaxID=2049356 RepID=UPI00355A6B04|nr:hypothetical protein MONOS_15220 [Monocercomonoides exilis]|eukprot:MONOS_15220.1-p1 / transcript=MONOS_15220.1 / gene=MONOS_15220 / organism=Monocercomonoides_exilis_PA203 / gene_product=unspecified product / transcript_product=unspecified product / location=Mono_scaffold01172:8857-10424(+) / protein_length=426 / sequence_SO=supercontig / SO=protein_coding / is_pseudo=false
MLHQFPSLEYCENSQLICLYDPNVEVVLIPPVELLADMVGYLKKLLVAGAAKQSSFHSAPSSSSTGVARRSTSPFRRRRSEEMKVAGDDKPSSSSSLSSSPAIDPLDASEAVASYTSVGAMNYIERRLLIVVPEATVGYALQMLWGYVEVRQAVLYRGVVCAYDVELSAMLLVQLVVQLPSLAASVGTNPEGKQIFASADVNAFLSIYDHGEGGAGVADPGAEGAAPGGEAGDGEAVFGDLHADAKIFDNGRILMWTSGLAEQLQEKGKIIRMSLMIILELSEEHNPKVKEVKELHEQLVAMKENVELTDVGLENDKKKQKYQCGLVGGDSEMQLTVSEVPFAMLSLLKKFTVVIKDGSDVMCGPDPSVKGVVVKVRHGAIVLGDTYNGGGGGGGREGTRSGFSQSSKKNYAGDNGGGGGVCAKE